jgi:hypothetical protein
LAPRRIANIGRRPTGEPTIRISLREEDRTSTVNKPMKRKEYEKALRKRQVDLCAL